MFFINRKNVNILLLTLACLMLLSPLNLTAQHAWERLMVSVNHRPAGDKRNLQIEDILNRTAVIALEQSGLKGVVLPDVPEEPGPEIKMSCRYLQQQDVLKLEYQLQEAMSGKLIAEFRIDTSVSHFLDQAVASAVKELLDKSRDEINLIVLNMQENETASAGEKMGRVVEPVIATGAKAEVLEDRETEQKIKHFSAELKASGLYMLDHFSEHLPYGLLLEGRLSYPIIQSEKAALQLGASLGIMKFFSAVDYKAAYVKTLMPLCLLTELRINKENSWTFRLWLTAGAALRPPHENELVDKLLAPAFPYTNVGIGVHMPFGSDRTGLSAGFSGTGLLHLYEDSATGEVQMETFLGINLDLGIVWRI